MENITTYYARRTNVLVWLSALLMLCSAALRIAFLSSSQVSGFWSVCFRIILPLAAILAFILQLLFRGEKQFCVTVRPVCLLAVVYWADIAAMGIRLPLLRAACIMLCLVQAVIYYVTYSGRLSTQIPAFLAYLAPLVFCAADAGSRADLFALWKARYLVVFANLASSLAVLVIIAASRKMPPYRSGDPYRPRLGDRLDGRLIRGMYPMSTLGPYFMFARVGAANFFKDNVEISSIERYIRQKRRDGFKHFGMMHVIIAAYVRLLSEYPGLNRFIAGYKIYARYDILVGMTVKKQLSVEGEETELKVKFSPSDTAADVYTKYNEAYNKLLAEGEENDFDAVARIINYIPSFVKLFAIRLLQLLDYFGKLPTFLTDLSPFHGSAGFTSMGSLGIPPIFHHLYDFGNFSAFCAFGPKRTEKSYDQEGNEVVKKFVDFTWSVDDRIIDGYYYAAALKRMRYLLGHPDLLDTPPETVKEDIW
jgi:hypothetical protein